MAKLDSNRKMVVALLEKMEIDTILYHLTEIAYLKRNAEDHKGGNRAEHDYWHIVGGILSKAQEEVSSIT